MEEVYTPSQEDIGKQMAVSLIFYQQVQIDVKDIPSEYQVSHIVENLEGLHQYLSLYQTSLEAQQKLQTLKQYKNKQFIENSDKIREKVQQIQQKLTEKQQNKPKSVLDWFKLGNCQLKLNKTQQARQSLYEAVKLFVSLYRNSEQKGEDVPNDIFYYAKSLLALCKLSLMDKGLKPAMAQMLEIGKLNLPAMKKQYNSTKFDAFLEQLDLFTLVFRELKIYDKNIFLQQKQQYGSEGQNKSSIPYYIMMALFLVMMLTAFATPYFVTKGQEFMNRNLGNTANNNNNQDL